LKRGDVVIVTFARDYGKPRPAVVVQSDKLAGTDSIILCPMTTHLVEAPLYRIDVVPDDSNGLREQSQIMMDKIAGTPRDRCRDIVGHVAPSVMSRLDQGLALLIGLSSTS
jgi:mRNA interferase MazF